LISPIGYGRKELSQKNARSGLAQRACSRAHQNNPAMSYHMKHDSSFQQAVGCRVSNGTTWVVSTPCERLNPEKSVGDHSPTAIHRGLGNLIQMIQSLHRRPGVGCHSQDRLGRRKSPIGSSVGALHPGRTRGVLWRASRHENSMFTSTGECRSGSVRAWGRRSWFSTSSPISQPNIPAHDTGTYTRVLRTTRPDKNSETETRREVF
jgi:hypothetical protein